MLASASHKQAKENLAMTTLYAFVGSEMRIVDNATFDTKNVEVVAKWVQHAYGEDDETNEDGYIVRNANGVLYAYVKYQCKGDDDVVTIHHLTEEEANLSRDNLNLAAVIGWLEPGS